MKTTVIQFRKLVAGCVFTCCLTAFSPQAFAIEGLQVSIQDTNAVLAWPSDPSESYLIQYKPSLTATNDWVTLGDFYPADSSTNITAFVDPNPVNFGSMTNGSSVGSGGGPMPPGGGGGGGGSGQVSVPGIGFYRVVRNGAHIWGVTNNMVLSGVVRQQIELALDTTDEVAGVTFYANGSPLVGAVAEGSNYNWALNWDTKLMPNGNYDLTAEIDFATQNEKTNTVPVTVTVNNEISFPNYFTRIYGNQMWIYAELATPSANFRIDLYDENTNGLGYFAGSTSDGIISFTWDLTDGQGNTFDSTNFIGVFKITPSAGSTATATNLWAKEPTWYPSDTWVVAYGPFDTSGFVTERQLLAMLGGSGGEYGGVIQTLDAYGLTGNLSPGNRAQSTAFALSNAAAKTNLLNYLADQRYKNFYFFGHGSPSAIGGINPGSKIDFNEIQKALGNFLGSARPIDQHPYRFVFIDGCDAGSGNFCEAFAIPPRSVNRTFFTSTVAVWSRAFLGFKSLKNFDRATFASYALMMGGFYQDWLGNLPLQQCVDNAVNGTHNAGIVKMDSSWVIYGATNLQHNLP